MFTGIITDIGRIVAADDIEGRRLRIETRLPMAEIPVGSSIAVSGICLTVVEKSDGWFLIQGSGETQRRTTLGEWAEGDRVNLERSLRIGDELGGHVVFGHVDDVGEIRAMERVGESHRLEVGIRPSLAPLIAVKGSIAADGISLTVNEAHPDRFVVNIIPHTWRHTTLADKTPGQRVNLEVDMLARYVARQLAFLPGRT